MESITGGVTLRQIFSEHWEDFCKIYPEMLTENIVTNVEKMLACRDPEKMGYAVYRCEHCPETIVRVPHTCKSRFCNTCGKTQTDQWIESCHNLLPNTDYHHITFTIPEELRKILYEKRELQHVLSRAAADTILSFFEGKHGVRPAITTVLHTFGRDAKWNPHIHMILSAGGLDKEGIWKEVGYIPFEMAKQRWKVKLLNGMKEKLLSLSLTEPDCRFFSNPQVLYDFFRDLYAKNWYVHLRMELINVKGTIQYIGRYTKRPIIAETRIIAYDGTEVQFMYDDHYSKFPVKVTCSAVEFIKKLIQHVPERYFRMIRHYGLIANRVATRFKKKLKTLFGIVAQVMTHLSWRQRQIHYHGTDPLICPHCKSELQFFIRFCPSRSTGTLRPVYH